MSEPRPGWYPDPSPDAESGSYRWWDGSSWTSARGDSATAPPPSDPQPVASATTPAARSGHRLMALLVGLSLVIGGGVVGVIGWANWQDHRRAAAGATASSDPPSAPANRSPTPEPQNTQRTPQPAGPNGRLDRVTREAMINGARMTLPGEPYELTTDPVTVPGVFDAMFVADAPVHREYNGTDDWNATVGIGHIPAEAWQGQDPKAFAEQALAGVTDKFFGGHPAKIKRLRHGGTMVDGQVCAKATADVHYRIEDLSSRYDRVLLIGCPAVDGSVITAVSSVPDDADDELVRLAEQSVSTLSPG